MFNFNHPEASFHTNHSALCIDDLSEAPLEDIQTKNEECDRNSILASCFGGDNRDTYKHSDCSNKSHNDAHINTQNPGGKPIKHVSPVSGI